MSAKTCCVTGHRDIAVDKLDYVKDELKKEVSQAVGDGYTHFISGFARGTDLLFASIVANLMPDNPALTLEAAIPYRNRLNMADGSFRLLLAKCSVVGVHSEAYTPYCYMQRNRFIVSQSQRIIAVYDGREKGGTLFTVRYALSQNREVHVITI